MSNLGTDLKSWLGFSYICSEDYELYLNFDETELKMKSDNSSNNKVKSFQGIIGVIEEIFFCGMNLIDGGTFPLALMKCEESKFNKNNNFPHDTKRRIHINTIKMVLTYRLSRYSVSNMMEIFFQRKYDN